MPGDPILISALTHWSYCPRRAGLVHLESVWEENIFTLLGQEVHERVDEPITRAEKGVRVERALPLWSNTYGLVGTGDVVEFRLQPGCASRRPVPVEFKAGGAKNTEPAEIQLCAQAWCLEEMFGEPVPMGFLYLAKTKTRAVVEFDACLKNKTMEAISGVQNMIETNTIPPPANDRRCRDCSLLHACLPDYIDLAKIDLDWLVKPRAEGDLP